MSCIFCGKFGPHMTIFSNLHQHEKLYIEKHHGNVPLEAPICKRHQVEAKRHYNDDSHVPKWKERVTTSIPVTCMYHGCTLTSATSKITCASFASYEKLMSAGEIASEEEEIYLCKIHYNDVYRKLKPINCASCNAHPKQGKLFTRHCPHPTTIYNILGQTLCIVFG